MSRKSKLVLTAVALPFAAVVLMACAHIGMMSKTPKPPASEFGYGPRSSINGQYKVTIEESAPFAKGKILKTIVRVKSANGNAAEGLQITVDGGMPQHGHGLPTKPRVTKDLGNGRYQVEGLKFNMGGWWELKFGFAGAANDSVVFNLDL